MRILSSLTTIPAERGYKMREKQASYDAILTALLDDPSML